MKKVKVAVLASGRGSNFVALAHAIERGELHAELCGVLSDREEAPVLTRARELGVPAHAVVREQREERDRALLKQLRAWGVEWVVCAGYMRVLSSEFIEAFRDPHGYTRIVNIHPALLPAFPGLDGYGQAFRQGCAVAGVTVHLVEPEVDSGPILAQWGFPIHDCRTLRQVEKRGLAVEHWLYAATLRWLWAGHFSVERLPGGRLRITPWAERKARR
jgi:phosphoribosylglycinamide formyltransferase-1